jgi:hypothetical protein
MKLSVADRIILLMALPKEGNYATLKILMNLRMSLSFTEDEIKEFGLAEREEGGTSWDNDSEVDIPIGEKATDIIVDAFRRLDRDKKLTAEAIDTYEKFIPTTE